MTPTAAAGWSAGSSIVGSIFGAIGAGKVADAQKAVALSNIEINKNSYLRRLTASAEQTEAINRELGTVMSRSGLEAMKAEARLRTAGASTGLSGGSIDEIINQTSYDEILDNQVNISRARKSKADVKRQEVVDWMNFVNQGETITSSMPQGGTDLFGALASGLTSGLGVYTNYVGAGGKDVIGNSISNAYGKMMGNTSANYKTNSGQWMGV